MRDQRNPNDLGRIMDSMFRPREFAGSRRGRVLLVLAAFAGIETAVLVNQIITDSISTFAWLLWGLWLVGCLAFDFIPKLGADEDSPGARRGAAIIAAASAGLGLLIFGMLSFSGNSAPNYWWLLVASFTVAAPTGYLGLRALTH